LRIKVILCSHSQFNFIECLKVVEIKSLSSRFSLVDHIKNNQEQIFRTPVRAEEIYKDYNKSSRGLSEIINLAVQKCESE